MEYRGSNRGAEVLVLTLGWFDLCCFLAKALSQAARDFDPGVICYPILESWYGVSFGQWRLRSPGSAVGMVAGVNLRDGKIWFDRGNGSTADAYTIDTMSILD
jgi:hypothetical protein